MNKETFLQRQVLAVAVRKISEFLETNPEADIVVLQWLRQHPAHKDLRIDHIEYEWGADGIEVWHKVKHGGPFTMSDEPETDRLHILRLKYVDVFGWEVDWNIPMAKRSEAITIVSEHMKKMKL